MDSTSPPPTEKKHERTNERPQIPPDKIVVTDIGIGLKSQAWYWLVTGHHVYDYRLREFGVLDLERSVDRSYSIDPKYIRGALWKTIPMYFWQGEDGSGNGLTPSQPGLSLQSRSVFL
jgi:hypothetical protein